MSVFREDQLEREELSQLSHSVEEVYGLDAIENIFDAEPKKKQKAQWEVRATGTIEGAKWSLSRVLSDVMDESLWRFTERQGTPELGKLEPLADRRVMCFREVRPVVYFTEEITDEVIHSVRLKFRGVFHENCDLLVGLKWVDELDYHQGALVTWNDQVLYSVRVPFREDGNRFRPEAGWTFWWAHHYTHRATQFMEFHDVIVEVPESGRKLRFIGLPEEIDALFSKTRGLKLYGQVNALVDNEWKWIPYPVLKDDMVTCDPIRVISAKGKTVEIKPRVVKRVCRFVNMPVNLPNLVGDAKLAWVAKAQEIMKEMAGGLKEIDHGDDIITEVLVPGSYRTPEEVLATGAVERITDSGLDIHEHAHFKLNEWSPCGEGYVNRLDPFPVNMDSQDVDGKAWVYRQHSPKDIHTMQDFYPRDGEEVYCRPDELDPRAEIPLQDVFIRREDMADVTKIDVGTIAFSMMQQCARSGCTHEFDVGLERKCPVCGKQAGFGILYTTDKSVYAPIRWHEVRANTGKLLVKSHELFGYTREHRGATNFGEFLSAVKRIIRDGECKLEVIQPDMFKRDLTAWAEWVEEHGQDYLYPGAMLKYARLTSLGEKSPKKVLIPTTFKNPDKFLRMIYGTPDGRAIHGRPNAVFMVKAQLRSGKMSKFNLRYPDMRGTESTMIKATIEMAEFRRHLGLGEELPTNTMVVTVMNDYVGQLKRQQDMVTAEIASSEEVMARLADKEVD